MNSTSGIVSNVYAQWGAIGVLGLVIFLVGVYLYKENKALKKENLDLQNARLQDTKDFAKIQAQPNDELVRFVRSLYDGWSNDKRGQ